MWLKLKCSSIACWRISMIFRIFHLQSLLKTPKSRIWARGWRISREYDTPGETNWSRSSHCARKALRMNLIEFQEMTSSKDPSIPSRGKVDCLWTSLMGSERRDLAAKLSKWTRLWPQIFYKTLGRDTKFMILYLKGVSRRNLFPENIKILYSRG